MSKFLNSLSRYAGNSFAYQLALVDFLGEHDWNVDTQKGVVDFSSGRTYPIQLLGTESEASGTWLWAWANSKSNLPDKLLQRVAKVRQYGAEQGLAELTNASVDLSDITGHQLAMLSAGIVGKVAYYRGPYDGGALYFLVENLPTTIYAPVAPEHALTVINELNSQFDVNPRIMVTSFLSSQGFQPESQGNKLVFKRKDGDSLTVEFDQLGRIIQLEGEIRPRIEIRPWWKFW